LNIWEWLIQQPVTNVLIVMSHYLGNSFGLAIIALTIIINLAMYPMTRSQIRSAKAMQDLQPKLAEIQKKFGKDKQKLAQEQMKLYKEANVKPAGCAVSMFIQMPVWIALYQAIMLALAVAPEGLLNLSKYLYPWPVVFDTLPLNNFFLGIDLSQVGQYSWPNMIVAVLVGVTMWIQQKMSTTVSTDPRQAQQAQIMLWMMPLMFTWFALSFPSGLAIYWVVNSIVRIVIQYRSTGWGGLKRQAPKPTEAEKKYIKFEAKDEKAEKVSSDRTSADIVLPDSETLRAQMLKPNKNRYQPGKDRSQHRPKK
jgi:YidC/Oxa1 family membrane protein insertase